MLISTKTILGQINISAPKGDRIDSNWNGGIREGARHRKGWGITTAKGRHPDAKVHPREKVAFFQKKKRANVVKL